LRNKNIKIAGSGIFEDVTKTASQGNCGNHKKLTKPYSRNTIPPSLDVDRKFGVGREG
jgi:hypothetical protein